MYVCMYVCMHICMYVSCSWIYLNYTYNISLQFEARATASITLVHESCPAGFEIVDGIIPGRYVCRCSLEDANILSCNRRSEHVLLRVRAQCMHVVNGLQVVLQCQFITLVTTSSPLTSPCSTPPLSSLHCPAHFTYFSPNQCRTGCGALLSPTQMVTESFSPQAVPVVTAAASHGIQTIGESAGSLCLRT